jgi:hypothetical protein
MVSLPTPVNTVINALIQIDGIKFRPFARYNCDLGDNPAAMCYYVYSVMVDGA